MAEAKERAQMCDNDIEEKREGAGLRRFIGGRRQQAIVGIAWGR